MLFNVKRKHKNISLVIVLLFLVISLTVFLVSADNIARGNQSKETEILTSAIDRSLTQCYALEGAYPSSLLYLEENYGLTYDKNHYYIDYLFIGSNLRPDITIIERD